MSLYDINFTELIRQQLPVRLRTSLRRKWLKALVSPIITMYDWFKAYRDKVLYGLDHTSQICFMEAVANDVFDNTARTIYITDGEFSSEVPLYLVVETKPVWLALDSEAPLTSPYDAPVWLYTVSEAETTGMDFIVHVPAAVAATPTYDVERLKALMRTYKLPGKRFKVVVEP